MDAAAYAAYKLLPSYDWEDYDITEHPDHTATLTFHDIYRNLARRLDADLTICAAAGTINGTLITDCTDGNTWRAVTHFENSRAYTASSECLNTTWVTTNAAYLQTIEYPHGELIFLIPSSEQGPVIYTPAPQDPCYCGGYDEETQQPLCDNTTGTPAPSQIPYPHSNPEQYQHTPSRELLDTLTRADSQLVDKLHALTSKNLTLRHLSEALAYNHGSHTTREYIHAVHTGHTTTALGPVLGARASNEILTGELTGTQLEDLCQQYAQLTPATKANLPALAARLAHATASQVLAAADDLQAR